jgi:phosphoglycerate kinase
MNKIKSIEDINLKSKRVLIRVDFNCPIKDGKVEDDTRIMAAISTIKYAIKKQAKVIILSHMGRPEGKKDLKYSLEPVGERLSEILDQDVLFASDCIGEGVWSIIENMKEGSVLLLENVRFHKEETKNDKNFAIELLKLFDVFINDAFGAVHRAHASTTTLANMAKEKGAGFLLKKEIDNLSIVLNKPTHPFCVILGGAKVSDKIAVLENFSKTADKMFIGGAMAYTFLKAKGFNVGSSLVEDGKIEIAKKILKRMETKGAKVILPIDHVIAKEIKEGINWEITSDQNIPSGFMGVDIGPKTIEKIKEELKDVSMLVWNGPMGVFEIEPFSAGTIEIAKAISENKNIHSVVGGGDSISAVKKAGVKESLSHVSTGGGASLEFLEGKTLPGIKSLEN